MASWLRSIASLLTVVSLAGTPALLSACVALCMPGMEAYAAPAVDTPDAACAEHAVPSTPAGESAITASAGPCCGEALAAPPAVVATLRVDVQPLADVAMAHARLAWSLVPVPEPPTRRSDRPAPPPPSSGRPTVLRI